jgi:hypothetical protein
VEVCLKHRYNAADHACAGKPGVPCSSCLCTQIGSGHHMMSSMWLMVHILDVHHRPHLEGVCCNHESCLRVTILLHHIAVQGPSGAARRQLGSLLRGLRLDDAANAVSNAKPATKVAAAAAATAVAAGAATAGRRQQTSPTAGRRPKGGGVGGFFSRAAATLQSWRDNPTPVQARLLTPLYHFGFCKEVLAVSACREGTIVMRILRCSLQADPANSIRGSAPRRQQHVHELQGGRQPAHQQQSASRPQASSCRQQQDLRPIEVCADCGQHFDTVRLLWKWHVGGAAEVKMCCSPFPSITEPSFGIQH